MGAVDAVVRGVFFTATSEGVVPAVLLDLSDGRSIPIYIGLWEAVSINSALNHETLPRPGTHDLFIALLKSFEIRVVGLRIDELKDGVFFGRLLSVKSESEECLDCRPSDGIAIALRAGAPISVDCEVAEQAGMDQTSLPECVDFSAYLS